MGVVKEYQPGDIVIIRRLKDLKCEFTVDYERMRYDGDYIRNNKDHGILCARMEVFTGLPTKIIRKSYGDYYTCEIDGSFGFNSSLFE